MSLWIKICGNTTLADAQLAAETGASAVGFVFAPSPRRVTVAQVAAIVPHLPPALEKIGVFVDAGFDEIAAAVQTAGLTGVQLHFGAPAKLTAQLRSQFGPNLRIVRVMHFDAKKTAGLAGLNICPAGLATGHDFADHDKIVSEQEVSGHDFSRADSCPNNGGALAPERCLSDPNADAILIDSRSATAPGGTGQTYDWAFASTDLFQNAKVRKHLIAAGGLTPENVAEAIRTLNPWGVDAVSGVEAEPGRKNASKLRAFIANARSAE